MISPSLRELHEANRASWNAAVIAHNSHKGDQIRFFREGGDTLFPEEVELLGDLRGRRMLHLMCYCGQDSLSLARRGACVVGVDISDQAIDFARNLSLRAGIAVEFHRADLYDWLADHAPIGPLFDVVFCSYGAVRYLSALEPWARSVVEALKPGGRLVLVDFHPIVYMFDRAGRLTNPYSASGRPRTGTDGVIDYIQLGGPALLAGEYQEGIRTFANPYPHHTFHWGLGDVTDAILGAGMRIDALREYPFANGQSYFHGSRVVSGRRVYPPESLPGMPMMFGVRAVR